MYITATILFILGMAAGSVYGYLYTTSLTGFFLAFATGGFAGSAAGAVVFILFYFIAQKNDDKKTYQPSKNGFVSSLTPKTPSFPETQKSSPQKDTKATSTPKMKHLKRELDDLKKKNNGRQP